MQGHRFPKAGRTLRPRRGSCGGRAQTAPLMLALLAVLCAPGARAGDLAAIDGEPESPPQPLALSPPSEAHWSVHVQTTIVSQAHADFSASYSGPNSMLTSEAPATAVVSTVFATAKLGEGLALIFNPELSGGSGLSQTLGVGAYPNGLVYRVGDPAPSFVLARLLLRGTIGLGGEPVRLDAGPNQLEETVDSNRLTLSIGRLALPDVFDGNPYSHDADSQFLGWGLMDSAAWDYAADTHGYTSGAIAELTWGSWSARFGALLVGQSANQMAMEWRFWKAGSLNGELESRWSARGRPGAVRVAAFLNDARMGDYSQALAQSPVAPDVVATRAEGRIKYGLVASANQELMASGLGLFSRLSWNDGHTESWSYSEVDRSAALGVAADGAWWRREGDSAGIAAVASGLSNPHRRYLAAGGTGFILGDGALDYRTEFVGEVYYRARLNQNFAVTGTWQPVINPGYNRARGPIQFFALRTHAAF